MTYRLSLSKLGHDGDSLKVGRATIFDSSHPLMQSILVSASPIYFWLADY